MNSNRPNSARAFSLLEVVLAIGIFAFALVAVLGLFGASMDGVRKLSDRDLLVAVGGAAASRVSELTRAELLNIPTGRDLTATGRPVLHGYCEELDQPGVDAPVLTWSTAPPAAGNVKGTRVFRVSVYRALQDATTEFVFDANQTVAFPVRILVELLAPGQTGGAPALSWSFHRTLLPRQ